jgi:hypothetical protein
MNADGVRMHFNSYTYNPDPVDSNKCEAKLMSVEILNKWKQNSWNAEESVIS